MFDQNTTSVVVVNAGDAEAPEAGDAGDSFDAPTSDGDGGPKDPCAPPPADTTLLYCNGFEADDAGIRSGSAWTSLVNATAARDVDDSVPRPGTSLHVMTTAEGQVASLGDRVYATKPTSLRLELDVRMHSHARGCAIAQFQFDTYYVRIIVEDNQQFGIDEYVQGASNSFRTDYSGITATPERWVHLALDVVTDTNAILRATLSIDGVQRISHDLAPTSAQTQPLSFEFDTVDRAVLDMHIDNVRVTRTP